MFLRPNVYYFMPSVQRLSMVKSQSISTAHSLLFENNKHTIAKVQENANMQAWRQKCHNSKMMALVTITK